MFSQMKINFQPIEDRVQAAKLLQEAGKEEDCHKVLNDLAKDLIKTVVKK